MRRVISQTCIKRLHLGQRTRGSVGWAYIAHLSFCFRKLNTEPSIGASHQISLQFGKAVSEKKIFRNGPIWNKNCLWWPCLLMDQNEMSNLYRGHSIDASYQVSYHLAKQFQRKSCFRNRPIRNKNWLWRPCLLTDQNRMKNSYRWPSIDASYHVSVHLAKLFQSRRFLEIDQSETRIACGGYVC
jgi:hypothetical protein